MKLDCPKCGTFNELNFGTCECKNCHYKYGKCKKCGNTFYAGGGISAVCEDCRAEDVHADSDGSFIGALDARIMNSNHNLFNDLLKVFVAIPILKPMKLRRKEGFGWWFGTLWLTFYLGAVFFFIFASCLEPTGPHKDLFTGIMAWSCSFFLFLAPRAISLAARASSKKVLWTVLIILILDIIAAILSYQFCAGSWKDFFGTDPVAEVSAALTVLNNSVIL